MDEGLEACLDAVRREVNDGQEQLLNRLAALERAFLDTKGFLAGDAAVSGRRWLDLDGRVARLERNQGNNPKPEPGADHGRHA